MPKKTLLDHMRVLPDPRKNPHNKIRHFLLDAIVIAVLAVLSGADSWVEISQFGRAKEAWLKKFLTLPNGIPSHDTFGRIFALMDADAFERCFRDWAKSLHVQSGKTVVALDGKSVRRSHGKNMKPLHIVSAFAVERGVVLGQRKVDGKSNEITAIPELIGELFLKGCIVTIDAMGTQAWIARKIIENKGDYVLAVKGNQGRLMDDIAHTFEAEPRGVALFKTSERAHGNIETRECVVSNAIAGIRDRYRWDGLKSIACITTTRAATGKTTAEVRYFISSLAADAKEILAAVRSHWRIENTLHWSLDVAFREDESRVRIGHAGENLSLVRKFALMLLRDAEGTTGLKAKRMKAAWDETYLETIFENMS